MHMLLRVKFDLQKLFFAVGVTQVENKKCLIFSFKVGCKTPPASTFDVDIMGEVQNVLYFALKSVSKHCTCIQKHAVFSISSPSSVCGQPL